MLPEKLSTDLTSLGEGQARLAIVIEMEVAADGTVTRIRRLPRRRAESGEARLQQRRRLARRHGARAAAPRGGAGARRAAPHPGRGRPGDEEPPAPARRPEPGHARGPGRIRRRGARRSAARREESGQGADRGLHDRGERGDGEVSRAARGIRRCGGSCARPSAGSGSSSSPPASAGACRRSRAPAPSKTSSPSAARRIPLRFPDLSLSVVKLLGSGEYVVELPGQAVDGHFGLAVRNYTHSTAPNRRFPDLVTQRLLKAAMAGRPAPYAIDELEGLARHCTEQEDNAAKVERQVRKSAAALLLAPRIGERFDAIVTGASEQGHVGPHPPAGGGGESRAGLRGARRRRSGARRARRTPTSSGASSTSPASPAEGPRRVPAGAQSTDLSAAVSLGPSAT